MPSLRSKQLFAAVVFVSSVVVLAAQLINPSPVVVTTGDPSTEAAELGSYFQYQDVSVIAVASCLLGSSGTYLLTAGTTSTTGAVQQTASERTDAAPASQHTERPPNSPAGTASTDGGNTPEPSNELLEARKEEWEETVDRLANKEQEVYEILLEADGVLPQSEIVDEADLSKASVSRALDGLEVKNLVERKRRGMGNVILLQ